MGKSLPVPRKNLGVKGGAGGLALATNLDPSGCLPDRHPPPHTTQDSAATGDE